MQFITFHVIWRICYYSQNTILHYLYDFSVRFRCIEPYNFSICDHRTEYCFVEHLLSSQIQVFKCLTMGKAVLSLHYLCSQLFVCVYSCYLSVKSYSKIFCFFFRGYLCIFYFNAFSIFFLRFEENIAFILVLFCCLQIGFVLETFEVVFHVSACEVYIFFVWVITMSSTCITISIPGIFGTSLVYLLNSVGPNTEPCGTPAFISLIVDVACSIFTWNVLFFKKELCQFYYISCYPNLGHFVCYAFVLCFVKGL